MIRMIQSTASKHAKSYFSNSLNQADYFINDVELQGKFFGKLCERLGISGTASKDVFYALCDNKNPLTGDKLSPRNKTNRTIGYDISYHAPKSVSIVHALTGDNKILTAFEKAVRETMVDIEAEAKVRVRKNGVYEDRASSELVWAEFIHQTSRSAGDGITPDMHLHAHNFVFNLAYDEKEQCFKAGKFREIMEKMPYFQSVFHKRLADEILKLGYPVKRTENSFEITSVPESVIRHFSKRTDQIGKVAKEKGITDPKALAQLGALTRAKKQKGLSMQDLRDDWKKQITELPNATSHEKSHSEQDDPVKQLQVEEFIQPQKMNLGSVAIHSAEAIIDYSLNHCFERASVVPDTAIMAEASRFALGNTSVSVEAIQETFKKDTRVLSIRRGTKNLCTTKAVLMEERKMVDLANKGIGTQVPLYEQVPEFSGLNEEQEKALSFLLTTKNQVSILRGAAGTGKTTLMKEARRWIEQKGKKIIAVAPTAEASRGVLRSDGFIEAETVAKLLQDAEMQNSLYGQYLWVDEAGLLSSSQMLSILELASKQNARVILGGDTRQHRAVHRGDALRILSSVGKLKPAEVSKVLRQKNSLYLQAVESLSNGQVGKAFDQLDLLGAIKCYDRDNPLEGLVKDYMKAVKSRHSTLVVSPTHKEGRKVTEALRLALRKAGKIGKKETLVRQLTSTSFTTAEKQDVQNFIKGQVIQFNQNYKGVKRGSSWTVRAVKDSKVIISNIVGHSIELPIDRPEHFDVFTESKIGLSKGDTVRITRNGFDQKNRRVDNGMTLKVRSVSEDGSVVLQHPVSKNKYNFPADHGHIDHAYCLTSHASQGRTVDEVFISQPAATFGATDLKQFYVSVSRGKKAVHLYTDDRQLLMECASELGDRQSALELMNSEKPTVNNHLKHLEIYKRQEVSPKPQKEKAKEFMYNKMDIDYEPVP